MDFDKNYGELLDSLEATDKKRPVSQIPKSYPSGIVYRRENYDDYLFHCHNFGRLMTGIPKPLTENQRTTYNDLHERFMGIGKALTERQEQTYFDLGHKLRAKCQLSPGAKTLCEEIVREDQFARRKTIETRYTDKGLIMEDASIKLYGQFIGEKLEKNTIRMANENWKGEADNIQGKVRDFKTSWDFTTFPSNEQEIKNKLYEWQLQLYMDLYGYDEAELVYCLVDTPARLVEDEIRRMDWKYDLLTVGGGLKDKHIPFVVEKVSNMVYTVQGLEEICEQSGTLEIEWFDGFIELSPKDRIKVFETKRNDKMLNQGREMVKLAREYMNKIK